MRYARLQHSFPHGLMRSSEVWAICGMLHDLPSARGIMEVVLGDAMVPLVGYY